MSVRFLLFAVTASLLEGTALYANAKLPIVDLGASIHQATFNVRMGPIFISELTSFRRPKGILTSLISTVGKSSLPQINPSCNCESYHQRWFCRTYCPQGNAAWLETAFEFVSEFITGPNITKGSPSSLPDGPSGGGAPASDSKKSEDCLLLDIMVLESVFNAPRTRHKPAAPVLLMIHGSGHVTGAKDLLEHLAGQIAESICRGRAGIEYVQINYRLLVIDLNLQLLTN